jgi:hypothetical protein
MGPSRADEDLSASFVSDDKQQRLEFGHELAGFVRGHCERWDMRRTGCRASTAAVTC